MLLHELIKTKIMHAYMLIICTAHVSNNMQIMRLHREGWRIVEASRAR